MSARVDRIDSQIGSLTKDETIELVVSTINNYLSTRDDFDELVKQLDENSRDELRISLEKVQDDE